MIGHQQAHAAGQGITGLKTQLQLDSTGEATANGAQENGKDDLEVCYFSFTFRPLKVIQNLMLPF